MKNTELQHTFSLHGVVAGIAPTKRSHKGPSDQLLTVTLGDDRARIVVPANVWQDEGWALKIDSRVLIRGRTDIGALTEGSRNVADTLNVIFGSGSDWPH